MMDDLISRQFAIKELESGKDKKAKGEIGGFYNQIIENDIEKLKKLPSAQHKIIHCENCEHWKNNHFAQPEPKTGHWIPVDSYTAFGGDEATWLAHGNPIAYHYCSECKNHAYALEDGEDLLSDFCPSCGSPMLKDGEG